MDALPQKRENEMCGVTALVYRFGNYLTKNKLQHTSVEQRSAQLTVTQQVAGSNPVGSVRQFNFSRLTNIVEVGSYPRNRKLLLSCGPVV